MGVAIRLKAAGVILVAKKGIFKEANEWGTLRRKKIQDLLKQAEEKNNPLLVKRVTSMRWFTDRIAGALKEQDALIKGISILTAKTGALKTFLAEMKGLQDRIDTFTRMYKSMKQEVYKMLTDADDDYWDKGVAWLKKDKPGFELIKRLFGDLTTTILTVTVESPIN